MSANASSSAEAGPSAQPSSSKDTYYPLLPNGQGAPSLREPPAEDLLPEHRRSLAEFRTDEGPTKRAAKLRSLWASLPKLPSIQPNETTDAQRMRLPGQDTLAALSPERADRLKTLYSEELVRRCSEDRPEASLWGGADDLEPSDTHDSHPAAREKGISWKAFR